MESKYIEDFEYLLGLIHGDGHIRKYSVSITADTRVGGYCDAVAKTMYKVFKVKPKRYREKNYETIIVHRKAAADAYKDYKKAGRWFLPTLKYPEEYLSGVIDTDGSVRPGGRGLLIHQKNKENLLLLVPIIKSLGVKKLSIKPVPTKNMFYLAIYGVGNISILAKSLHLRHSIKRKRLKEYTRLARTSRIYHWGHMDDLILSLEEPITYEKVQKKYHMHYITVTSYLNKMAKKGLLKAKREPFRTTGAASGIRLRNVFYKV